MCRFVNPLTNITNQMCATLKRGNRFLPRMNTDTKRRKRCYGNGNGKRLFTTDYTDYTDSYGNDDNSNDKKSRFRNIYSAVRRYRRFR